MCTYLPSENPIAYLHKGVQAKSVKIQHLSCTKHCSLSDCRGLDRYRDYIQLAIQWLLAQPEKAQLTYHRSTIRFNPLKRFQAHTEKKEQGCFPYYPFEVICFSAHNSYQDWYDRPCLPCCARTFLVGPSSPLNSIKVCIMNIDYLSLCLTTSLETVYTCQP